MTPPLIIAHRGASHDAPENTMAAFRLAWAQGADGVETDLRLTADGHIVAIHDSDGRRTLDDPRPIKTLALAELQALDAGRWKHRRWAGERVPTLDELLTALPDGKQLVLELKEDLSEPLALKLSGAPCDRITLIAFDAEIIADAKRLVPDCPALWLFNDYGSIPKKQRAPLLAARVRELGIDGVDLRYERRLTEEILSPLRQDGKTAFTYTIDRAGDAKRCLQLGLDGITTNRPGAARHWLGIST